MKYITKPCQHCGRHSRIDTQYCPWCWKPYKATSLWWEAFKMAAVIVLAIVVIGMVFL
jgi:RNA polymerase subunit RPABC4/transcription elongation factor Spt4